MKYSDERVLKVLRTQAWERAKAEIQSVTATFFYEDEKTALLLHDKFIEAAREFVEKVESEGLAE